MWCPNRCTFHRHAPEEAVLRVTDAAGYSKDATSLGCTEPVDECGDDGRHAWVFVHDDASAYRTVVVTATHGWRDPAIVEDLDGQLLELSP